MKIIISILFYAALSAICVFSCGDDVLEQTEYKEGLIIYTGSFATDGCEWVIEVDTTTFWPVNLKVEFQQHLKEVLLDYEELGEEIYCGYPYPPTPKYTKIKILEIKSK